MRAVVQRVKKASVSVDQKQVSEINTGLLILLGIEHEDTLEDVKYLSSKITQMRIFSDSENKMNLNVQDVQGDILVVSQFTLHASTKKGNRPSFIKSAKPEIAKSLYSNFISQCKSALAVNVKQGVFGAMMDIELINAGPVTILLDSKNKE